MPAEIQSGQVVWFEEDLGSLIGRAEIANIAARVASSFSCAGGCNCPPNFSSSYLNPSSCTGIVGDSMSVQALEMRVCNNISYGPYDRTTDATWNSGNTSIATASGGSVSCVGIGSTSMYAQFTGTVYGYNCAVNTVTTVPNGAIAVKPLVAITNNNFDPDSVFQGGSPDTSTGSVSISASPACDNDANCLHSGDFVVVELIKNTSGGSFSYSAGQSKNVPLSLGDTVNA